VTLDNVTFFKIGLQLFITGDLSRLLQQLRGKHIFVDLKLPGDIGNTIAAVVDFCVKMNVQLLTLSESMPLPAIISSGVLVSSRTPLFGESVVMRPVCARSVSCPPFRATLVVPLVNEILCAASNVRLFAGFPMVGRRTMGAGPELNVMSPSPGANPPVCTNTLARLSCALMVPSLSVVLVWRPLLVKVAGRQY
jgi:hypothetical protein